MVRATDVSRGGNVQLASPRLARPRLASLKHYKPTNGKFNPELIMKLVKVIFTELFTETYIMSKDKTTLKVKSVKSPIK